MAPSPGASALRTGRQLAMPSETKESMLSCAFFRIQATGGTADFAELSGITSEVERQGYRETGPKGAPFSQHAGRSKPPTITLKRSMRTGPSTKWIWQWHQLARASSPQMLRDTTLLLYGSGDDPSGRARIRYMLMNAFPARVELTGMTLGASQIVVQTVVLECDDIIDDTP